jgi:4-hydroxy 2-oxovalerate aldolase
MTPLQLRYGWGWDFTYMLSGLIGIHPTYCQELKTGQSYDVEDVTRILEDIPPAKRAKYDERELLSAEGRHSERLRGTPDELPVSGEHMPEPAEQILVVAGGPHVKRHAEALRQFIRHRPKVLECNDTGVLRGIERDTVVMNSVRLHEMAVSAEGDDPARRLLTGLPSVPAILGKSRRARVRYTLGAGQFDAAGTEVVVPGYVVGMLAVATALRSRPARIFLAGFDGFDDPAHRADHAEMETFWSLSRSSRSAHGVEFASLLPTHYTLPVRGLYGFL